MARDAEAAGRATGRAVTQPQAWRGVALVYPASDAAWRTAGRRGRCRRAMTGDELAAIRAVLERVPDAIARWSDGAARLELVEVRVIERPIRSLSATGEEALWAGPGDVRPDLERLVAEAAADSAFVVWPSDGRTPLCGWGCSIGPSPEARGAGFSSIVSDEWRDHARRPYPEEGFVHEWLHQVEATYRSLGLGPDAFPALHDAEVLTSCRPASEPPYGRTYRWWHDREPAGHTWQPWYADWLTGRVRRPDGGGCFGFGPEVWAARNR